MPRVLRADDLALDRRPDGVGAGGGTAVACWSSACADQRVSATASCLERQTQHRALLRLGLEDHRTEGANDSVESLGRVLRRMPREHRKNGGIEIVGPPPFSG